MTLACKVWERPDGRWVASCEDGSSATFEVRGAALGWVKRKQEFDAALGAPAVVQRPFDKLICPWCGDFVDASRVVRVRFDLTSGIDVGMDVCTECSTKQPCRANVTGIHGEIYDGDHEGARPPLPFRPDHQHGWCSRCLLPFVWSVETQRWVDYPEELTPRGQMMRLMDALDHGEISQDDYDERLVALLEN